MPIFDKRFVVSYFAQCRGGGTGLLDVRRPSPVSAQNRTRRIRVTTETPIRGVIGSHYPVTGDDESFDDEGSLRIGDEKLFTRGPDLRIADQQTDSPGDLLYVQTIEQGRFAVTGSTDGPYTITVSGAPFTYNALGDDEEAIRDGLLAAIGAPAGFSVAGASTDEIVLVGTVKGIELQVATVPASLQYVVESFRDDIYELYRRGQWVDGKFGEYGCRLDRTRSGV
jgi:hypothetical protein